MWRFSEMNAACFSSIGPGSLIIPWLEPTAAKRFVKYQGNAQKYDRYAELFTVIGLANDVNTLLTINPEYRAIQEIWSRQAYVNDRAYMVIWDFQTPTSI